MNENIQCLSCNNELSEHDLTVPFSIDNNTGIKTYKCSNCGSTFVIEYEDDVVDTSIKTEESPMTEETTVEMTESPVIEGNVRPMTEFECKFKAEHSNKEGYVLKEKSSRMTVYINKKKSIVLMKSSKKIRVEFWNVKEIKEDADLVVKKYGKDTVYSLTTKDENKYNEILSSIVWNS